MTDIIFCPECCSSEYLNWSIHKKSNAPEGKLTTHDVSVLFVLSCEQCSEDVDVVSDDTFMSMANEVRLR